MGMGNINKNKITKIIKPLFFFAVTLLIFYFIFRKVDYFSLKEVLLNVKWRYLVLAFLIVLLTLVLVARKWQAILGAMDYRLGFKESFRIIMAAAPISTVTPAKAGDLIRAYYLKDKIPVVRVMGGVVAERFIDISILAFYSFLGAVFLKNWLIIAISLSILFLIPLFFLVINRIKFPPGRWQERIEGFLHISKIFIREPKKLFPILFYGAFIWSLSILLAKVLFLALGADIPIFYVAAAFPLTLFISLLPITMAGMGTRDWAIIYFFSSWASPSVCLGVGLLYSLLAYWLLALLGLPFMKNIVK